MASRYFINGIATSNWSDILNWSLTDGGVGGQLAPTAADDVFFTSNSPACTVNTSARVAKSLNFTGYTNTITMSQQITVSGSVTLVSAMTIAGSGALLINATGTLTSNGKSWPNAMTINGTITATLADNWTVQGTLTLGSGSGTTTIDGSTLNASAGLTGPTTVGSVTGTTLLNLIGTGTVSSAGNGFFNNLTINTAGTITFAAAPFVYSTGTFTYTAGTVVTTGATLANATRPATLNLNGMTWNAVSLTGSVTVTLTSDLTVTGLLTIGTTSQAVVINGCSVNAGGGIRYAGTTGICSGTTILRATGTSTIDAPSITTGKLTNPIMINAPGGTVTIASVFTTDLAKVSYTDGTVIAGNTWARGSRPTNALRQQVIG